MSKPIYLVGALGATSLLLLWASLHLRRRHRTLRDMPTSKAAGVFIGLVELKGTAEAAQPLRSELRGAACVQFAWSVDERWSRTETETYTDKDGKTKTRTVHKSGWTTVASGGQAIPFHARDDTGTVLIRPEGAKLEPVGLFSETVSRGDPLYYGKGPAGSISDSDHVRRFHETGIPLHAPLYIVGQARERADVVAPEIAADEDAALFLISTRTEEKVLRGYGAASWVVWVLAAAAAGAAGFFTRDPPHPGAVAGGVAAFAFAWMLGWIWMAYNSLVTLRERVRQGWSLIDVQLKRRHDLIPNLVAALGGLRTHEAEVQTALAAMRSQLIATAPGLAGPDPDGLAGSLRAVIERYPSLTADEGFRRLHQELVSTEQRIALARSYYNDIATEFATRLEVVPDRWVALLGAMKPLPLLGAAGFERAVVQVEFAT